MKTLLFSLLSSTILVSCIQAKNQKITPSVAADNTIEVPNPNDLGTDPLAVHAWHLENIGQSTFSANGGMTGKDFSIKDVHAMNITGNGIRIAISDTGVDTVHSDLSGNQLSDAHRNYTTNTSSSWNGGGDPYPIEHEGHGTAVTGLTSAIGWNGLGSRGVAPNSKFGAFLFVGDFHTVQSSYEAKVLHQMDGDFDIFNYSYGYAGCKFTGVGQDVIDAYKYGVTNLRNGKGAIYIKAAGNDYRGNRRDCNSGATGTYLGNTNTDSEQNLPYLMLAGASNALGNVASYSTPGSGLWVTSAGGEFGTSSPAMLTTDIRGCTYGLSSSASSVTGFNNGVNNLNGTCNYTSVMNGTSAAAPVLSGIVALMLEANPSLTWRDVKHILAMTATVVSYNTSAMTHPSASMALAGHDYDYYWFTNGAGRRFSNTFGFGIVNAKAAVNMAQSYTSTLGTYQESSWISSGAINDPIPDNSATGVTNTINVATNLSIESVQIKLSVTHAQAGRLGVELTSPSNIKSKILLINSNIDQINFSDHILLTNAFYGENSSGNWTIKIIDAAAGTTGDLVQWSIKINGH